MYRLKCLIFVCVTHTHKHNYKLMIRDIKTNMKMVSKLEFASDNRHSLLVIADMNPLDIDEWNMPHQLLLTL